MHKVVLVILCKRPKLHQGKQRLAKTLGAELAYQLSTAFLNCALEDLNCWTGPVVISPAHVDDVEWAETLCAKARVLPQVEGNIGARMQMLDLQLRRMGYREIIFLGTDVPMLTPAHFAEAKKGLLSTDIMLSRAADGGVTLMGSRTGWPDLVGLPWSTADLGSELISACRRVEKNIHFISDSYDIDEEADLKRLYADLQGDQRPQRIALLKQLQIIIEIENKETGHA